MDSVGSVLSLKILTIALKCYIYFPCKVYISSKLFLFVYFVPFLHLKVFLCSLGILGRLLMIYSEGLKNIMEALSLWELGNITLNFTPEWCGWVVCFGTPDVTSFRCFLWAGQVPEEIPVELLPVRWEPGYWCSCGVVLGAGGSRLKVSLLHACDNWSVYIWYSLQAFNCAWHPPVQRPFVSHREQTWRPLSGLGRSDYLLASGRRWRSRT